MSLTLIASASSSERRPRIVDRLFTDGERRDAHSQPERLAARFAAKEAVLKTLGIGAGVTPWRSIEVTLNASGAPSVVLHEQASEIAESRGRRVPSPFDDAHGPSRGRVCGWFVEG